jgi:hypothetical protein
VQNLRMGAVPDWEGTVATLVEVLEDVLDQIDESRRLGTRSDIVALDVLDTLNKYLDIVKTDMGV